MLCFMVIGRGDVLSQPRLLTHGKMVANGTTYDVRIRDDHRNIYIEDDSLYEKKKTLFNHKRGAVKIPEHFIFVNTDKLLEIKKRFYPPNVRADIRVTITKEGEFMGPDYILPKTPMITKQQFGTLDAEVRKYLKVSVVFPTEWVKNQEYDGYATKYLKLE